MHRAGVGWRAAAVLIDSIVIFVLYYVVATLVGLRDQTGIVLIGGGALLVELGLALAYYILLEAMYGATVGKMLMGLRVVTADGGGPIGWSRSLMRNLLRLVDGLVFYLVAAILVWSSETRQRLGDRVAGTAVVRTGRGLRRLVGSRGQRRD